MVPLLLPTLIVSLTGEGSAPKYVGLISGISAAVASIIVVWAGWLSDRLPRRKPLLILGYGLAGTLVGLLGLATSWVTVLLLVTFAWLGRGLVSAPRNALIADSTDSLYYGHAFGFRQTFDTFGAILGPLIVYAGAGLSVDKLFFITFIPGVLALLSIVFLVKEVPRKVTSPSSPAVSLLALPMSFYLFCFVMFVFGIGNFNRPLLLLHLQETLKGTMSSAAILSLLTLLYIGRNIAQAGAAYAMGALSDTRLGRKIPLGFGFFLFGCMTALLIWPSTSMAYLMTVFLLSGISAGTYTTLEKSYAAELLPEHKRGTGYGLLLTIDSIGDLLSSIIVGFLWSSFSPQIGFLYATILSFLAAVLMLALPRKQAGSSLT